MDDGKFVDALGDLRIDNFRLLRLASDWLTLHCCHLSSECGKVRKSADLSRCQWESEAFINVQERESQTERIQKINFRCEYSNGTNHGTAVS